MESVPNPLQILSPEIKLASQVLLGYLLLLVSSHKGNGMRPRLRSMTFRQGMRRLLPFLRGTSGGEVIEHFPGMDQTDVFNGAKHSSTLASEFVHVKRSAIDRHGILAEPVSGCHFDGSIIFDHDGVVIPTASVEI
jgi:hypothetical protein